MAANMQFKRGLLANLPAQISDGTIYITTDEHAMYVDYKTQRIRLGDFIPVNTISDLPASGHAYETAVYYVKEGNILARWDATNSRWIQINKAGIVGITTAANSPASGNVISSVRTITAADGTLQLEITKATVATSEDLSELMNRVATIESDLNTANTGLKAKVATIQGDENTSGSILNAVATARNALLNNETTYTTFKKIGDALREIATNLSAAQTDIDNLQTNVNTLGTIVGSHTSTLNTLTANANTEGSIDYKIAQEASIRASEDTSLGNRLTTAETDISNLSSTVSGHTSTLNTLTGGPTVEGSVQKTVADAIAAIVANAPSDFDTLKEISDWISSHADSAATMNSQIQGLLNDVEDLQSDVSTLSSNYTNLEARVATNESNITTLQGNITTLNGADNITGSVAQKIKTALDPVKSDVSDIQTSIGTINNTISSLQNNIDIINGDVNTSGSIASAVAAEATLREAADNALDGRLDSLESDMTTAQSDINDLKDDVDDLTSRLTWVDLEDF